MMSEQRDVLAQRIRAQIGGWPGLTEKRMFGGIAFMLNDHMLMCPMKDGTLLARVGKEGMEAALARPGTERMVMGEREMGGFVVVSEDGLETDDDLAEWIAISEMLVRAMPDKAPPASVKRRAGTPARR